MIIKSVHSIILCILCMSFFPLILLGCATGHQHLDVSNATGIKIEVLPSKDKNVEIKKVSIFQAGNELVVVGEAKHKGPIFTTYKGHVDIAVIHPDKRSELATVEYVHHPSRQIISSFDVHFPAPAKGAKVLLIFHPTEGFESEHSGAVEKLGLTN